MLTSMEGDKAKDQLIEIRNPTDSVPDEILEIIFQLGSTHHESYLQTLCTVSRRWRSVATNCCALWTSFPPVSVIQHQDRLPNFNKIDNTLRLYLSRSGVLPISFAFTVESDLWADTQAQHRIQSIFVLLTDHTDRWGEITLHLPYLSLDHLLPRRHRRFPILSKLDFQMMPNASNLHTRSTIHFDYFPEAPKLREIKLDVSRASYSFGSNYAIFNYTLPWKQLESFNFRCKSDTSYHNLLQHPPPNLKRLHYVAKLITQGLPLQPVAFHRLEVLTLRVAIGEGEIAAHLNTLTLPSLVDLEIRYGAHLDLGVHSLYGAVLSLIQRSGCSLQRLALDPDCSNPVTTGPLDILSLSPTITDLDIWDFNAKDLIKLILDPMSAISVLPKLEKLTLRSARISGISTVADAAALMQMMKSRTEALRLANEAVPNRGNFRPLKEVFLFWAYVDYLAAEKIQELLFESRETNSNAFEGSIPVTKELSLLAWRTRMRPWVHFYFPRTAHRADTNELSELDEILGELEDVDIENVNSLVLTRRHIPSILHIVGNVQEDGGVPGDPIFDLRFRAKSLCEKWKPYIIRDVRATPYRWKFGGSQACLTWHAPSQGEDEDDECIWKEISESARGRYRPLFQTSWW